jgi:hypothetical protein
MFLLSLTKNEDKNFSDTHIIEEFKINGLNITIIVDGLISKIIESDNGIRIVDTLRREDSEQIIKSLSNIDLSENKIEIYKSLLISKPIYYHISKIGEFYCSTHITMLKRCGVKLIENILSIPEFFAYRDIMPPNTIYKNIFQLNTGNKMIINIYNGKLRAPVIQRFNPFKFENTLESEKEIIEKTSKYLVESIKYLHPEKDRVSLLLSGGWDSSLFYKICESLDFRLDKTYSAGYPFDDINLEKKYSLAAAEEFNIEHEYYEPDLETFLKGIMDSIAVAERPLSNMQSVLLFLLMRDCIPYNKEIVLNGEGNALYIGGAIQNILYRYKKSLKYKLMNSIHNNRILNHISKIVVNRSKFYSKVISSIDDPNHIIWNNGDNLNWVSKYFNTTKKNIIKNRFNEINPYINQSIYDILAYYNYLKNNTGYNSSWVMLGESQGKIMYFPYTYPKLTKYLFTVPYEYKMDPGKRIIHLLAKKNNVSDIILNRSQNQKIGFNPLSTKPLLKGGVLDSLIPIASKVIKKNDILKAQPKIWDFAKFWIFWNMINYAIWKRLFIQNDSINQLKEEIDLT